MLASISPVGEASRRQRWPVTATAHLVGSTLGGAATGGLAGALGATVAATIGGLDQPVALTLLAVVAVTAVVADLGVPRGRLALPTWQRQVDERWLTRYRGWVYGFGYGLQLGAGLLTRIPTGATHLLVAAALLTTSPVVGAGLGAVFGAVRAAPVLATRTATTPAALQALHRRLDAVSATAHRAAIAGCAAVATVAVVTAIVSVG